jgi:hypothetical protein
MPHSSEGRDQPNCSPGWGVQCGANDPNQETFNVTKASETMEAVKTHIGL